MLLLIIFFFTVQSLHGCLLLLKLKQVGDESIEVHLKSVSLESKIWKTFELEDLHLLALITDDAAATLLTGALIIDTADLHVDAFALTFSAILGTASVAVHGRVFGHLTSTLEEVVEIDLLGADRVAEKILSENFERAIEAGANVDAVAAIDMSRRLGHTLKET